MKKCVECKKLKKENKKLQKTAAVLRKVIFEHINTKYSNILNAPKEKNESSQKNI